MYFEHYVRKGVGTNGHHGSPPPMGCSGVQILNQTGVYADDIMTSVSIGIRSILAGRRRYCHLINALAKNADLTTCSRDSLLICFTLEWCLRLTQCFSKWVAGLL